MDGAAESGEDPSKTVMVLGATNLPWTLDEALKRRLEKRIYIPLPAEVARVKLFEINLKSIPVDPTVDMTQLAKATEGYSGADITNLCRDASMMCMRRMITGLTPEQIRNLKQEDVEAPISQADFEQAIAKVQSSVGAEQLARYREWMDEFGST
eukprot:g29606.t1